MMLRLQSMPHFLIWIVVGVMLTMYLGSKDDISSDYKLGVFSSKAYPVWPGAISEDCRMPKDFVHLKAVDATIQQDMRYATTQNVFGDGPLPGYRNLGNEGRTTGCVLERKVAESLKEAQEKLRNSERDLSLMVYDCFRPKKTQEIMKKDHSNGSHVAQEISHHSRGQAVDITIVDMSEGQDRPLDMGSEFDEFKKSKYVGRKNQKKLRDLMASMGECWQPHDGEWWHFVYVCEEEAPARNFDIPSYESCHGKEDSTLFDDESEQSVDFAY